VTDVAGRADAPVRDPFDLSGHVVVVTGGNSGIGAGIARALAAAGAGVAVWGRRPGHNQAVAAELAAMGARAVGVECDVADEASVDEATRITVGALGRIDSCVTSAGVASQPYPVGELPAAEWQRVLGINLGGTFTVMRSVTRHLLSRGAEGSLIAISSVSALHGHPRAAPYAAAKAGITGFVRSLAVELARHGIRANAVLPGWIDTELIGGVTHDERTGGAILRRIPLRRWGTPEDLGGVIVYLASRASRYHTGDVIRVDGGYAIF
jgi:NAD(P)-dependent dehydrogenase (short-subunit alcohol dehydrogenase family)